MVTLNNEIQNFYDNLNGKVNNLNVKTNNLMDTMDKLKQVNMTFGENLSYYYKGEAQNNALLNVAAINDRLNILSESINEKLLASVFKIQDILDLTKQLIEMKNNINSAESANQENDTSKAEYLFNEKQREALKKIKELIDLDELIDLKQKDKNQIEEGEVDTSQLDLMPGSYKEYKYTASNGVTIDYFAYIPANIESVKDVPVHLHLWPSRQNGGSMGYYNVHGLPKILYEGGTPSGVVICPKLEANEIYDVDHIDAIKELSDSFVSKYSCDKNKISISGQGGGGQAAINFAAKYPDYFTKVVSLYSLDTANSYDEIGLSKEQAEANLAKNDIILFRCTGGKGDLDERSINYTNKLFNSLKNKSKTNIDLIDNPHYIYGDDLFSDPFTYEGKTYKNLLEYCLAQEKQDKDTSVRI